MVALYITSAERAVGKTTLAAVLGKQLQDNRKRVGYFKPRPTVGTDPDATTMRQLLGLKEGADILSPVVDDPKNVSGAYERAAEGKDVVIVEGMAEKSDGIVATLDARVVRVVGYSSGLSGSEIVASVAGFGKNLLGVLVNKVPANRVENVQKELSTHLASTGIKLLGTLPEDRTLAALTVGELAEVIGGDVLSTGSATTLVPNFMVGAMGLDSGVTYFNRKTDKAVVARVTRPDMQMAALETPTACLIITDDKAPAPVVLNRAKQKKVPIVMVRDDIKATLSRIEKLDTVPFSPGKKLSRMAEIMQPRFDFTSLYQGLGIATR